MQIICWWAACRAAQGQVFNEDASIVYSYCLPSCCVYTQEVSATLLLYLHLHCDQVLHCNIGKQHACVIVQTPNDVTSPELLQGNLHAVRDDINNRVEYALWQQRQAHEASLEQIHQQHAQDLQAAVSHFSLPIVPMHCAKSDDVASRRSWLCETSSQQLVQPDLF